jgi:hypothetical protein
LLTIVTAEAAIPVRCELLARVVTVVPETLIKAYRLPVADVGQEWLCAFPQARRQLLVILDEAGIIADILLHDEASGGGDGCLVIAGLLALGDEIIALLLRTEVADDEDVVSV